MDAHVINTFLMSTTQIFKQMWGLELNHAPPFVMDNLLGHRWDITGIIAITGQAKGVIAVRMHRVLVDKLLEHSGLDFKTDEERYELIDSMVGEFINIVGGNASTALTEYHIDISVPVIVQGEGHRISWPKITPVICIPFRTKWGDFEVDVCFK